MEQFEQWSKEPDYDQLIAAIDRIDNLQHEPNFEEIIDKASILVTSTFIQDGNHPILIDREHLKQIQEVSQVDITGYLDPNESKCNRYLSISDLSIELKTTGDFFMVIGSFTMQGLDYVIKQIDDRIFLWKEDGSTTPPLEIGADGLSVLMLGAALNSHENKPMVTGEILGKASQSTSPLHKLGGIISDMGKFFGVSDRTVLSCLNPQESDFIIMQFSETELPHANEEELRLYSHKITEDNGSSLIDIIQNSQALDHRRGVNGQLRVAGRKIMNPAEELSELEKRCGGFELPESMPYHYKDGEDNSPDSTREYGKICIAFLKKYDEMSVWGYS